MLSNYSIFHNQITTKLHETYREDSALFTCVATNAFGSDDTSINFFIQEKPETPHGLKVIDKTGRSVKLSWQAPYNGNSNLTRYIIEFKTTKGEINRIAWYQKCQQDLRCSMAMSKPTRIQIRISLTQE